jgi:hypothetical protein
MNNKIEVVAEHSVCLELLPQRAKVLDAGCRGFLFTNYLISMGHDVFAIDIDELKGGNYMRVGIGAKKDKMYVSNNPDPQGKQLTSVNTGLQVTVLTLADFEIMAGQKFDLIKLDIEGEEISILNTVQHPMAKQVSVEFHAHCTNQTKQSIDELLNRLQQFYTIHNAVWESKHGAGFNYWDVLLIAK